MRRRINLFACCTIPLLGAALVGCDPGSVGGGDGVDVDDRLPEVKCEASLAISGTFATSVAPPPTAADGCVPEGVWTVAVTVMSAGDCAAVNVGDEYVFDVVGTGRDRTFTLRDAPAGAEISLNIHAGGNGECEFTFESITPAASGGGEHEVILLKPYTEPGLTPIAGSGTYQLWTKHP